MAQGQRIAAPLALDDGCVAHQAGEAATVERRGHGDQPQIGPQARLCIQRQREAEIAVEAAFVHLVEQHGRHARQLGIGLDTRDEDALGDDGHAGRGADLGIHAGGIAEGAADRLLGERSHPLGGGTRGEAAGREQDLAGAPGLVEERGRDGRGLARGPRGRRWGVGQRGEQIGQDGGDGQGHGAALRGLAGGVKAGAPFLFSPYPRSA